MTHCTADGPVRSRRPRHSPMAAQVKKGRSHIHQDASLGLRLRRSPGHRAHAPTGLHMFVITPTRRGRFAGVSSRAEHATWDTRDAGMGGVEGCHRRDFGEGRRCRKVLSGPPLLAPGHRPISRRGAPMSDVNHRMRPPGGEVGTERETEGASLSTRGL